MLLARDLFGGIRCHEPQHLLLQLRIHLVRNGHNIGKQRAEFQLRHVLVQSRKDGGWASLLRFLVDAKWLVLLFGRATLWFGTVGVFDLPPEKPKTLRPSDKPPRGVRHPEVQTHLKGLAQPLNVVRF